MGRPIFEICFNCKCGGKHSTEVLVPFLNPPTPETSAADVYRNQPLPEKLRSFLSAPFACRDKPEINELPEINAFFFAFTGQTTIMVA